MAYRPAKKIRLVGCQTRRKNTIIFHLKIIKNDYFGAQIRQTVSPKAKSRLVGPGRRCYHTTADEMDFWSQIPVRYPSLGVTAAWWVWWAGWWPPAGESWPEGPPGDFPGGPLRRRGPGGALRRKIRLVVPVATPPAGGVPCPKPEHLTSQTPKAPHSTSSIHPRGGPSQEHAFPRTISKRQRQHHFPQFFFPSSNRF